MARDDATLGAMPRLLRLPVLGLIACLAGLSSAKAEGSPPSAATAPTPNVEERSQARLERLLERLAESTDAAEARGIADQIERIWGRSGSDTADLLMERVKQAMQGRDIDLAFDLIDHLAELRPQWPEVWHRRAAILIQQRDHDGAMRDLARVLALEPRHYLAMAGVGIVLQRTGHERRALAAFRAALKQHPHLPGIKENVERLAAQHDGRDL